MKFDITLYAELLIYTGYAWRNMTESEKEILEPGRVLPEYPENPKAGDVVVAVDWKKKKAKIRVRDLFSGKTDVRQYLTVDYSRLRPGPRAPDDVCGWPDKMDEVIEIEVTGMIDFAIVEALEQHYKTADEYVKLLEKKVKKSNF